MWLIYNKSAKINGPNSLYSGNKLKDGNDYCHTRIGFFPPQILKNKNWHFVFSCALCLNLNYFDDLKHFRMANIQKEQNK